MKINKILILSVLLITGCQYSDPQLEQSSQITEGTSKIIPTGLVEWCNTLTTESFYKEPECLWYCRLYSKNNTLNTMMVTKAKAEITTCEPH